MSWAPYMHPSGEYILFASNKLGFENFELFMVDIDGHEGAGPRHLLRRLRRPAGAVARRHASSRGPRAAPAARAGQMFLAQWNHEKALDGARRRAAARKPSNEHDEPHARLARAARRGRRSASSDAAGRGTDAPPASQTRAARRGARVASGSKAGWPARPASGSPATTSSRELKRIGAQPLPGQNGLSAAVRVHRRHARRRLDVASTRGGAAPHASRRARDVQALSFSDNGEVSGAGRLRRLRHRRARERRTSATTATRRST